MCGIAGHAGPRTLEPPRVAAALESMRHRGPDARGVRAWRAPERSVELLHTRLGIIDLDARAAQPFRHGSRWFIYNGELYNYRELRAELGGSGEVFTTTSDTDVFLRALARGGLPALDRCEGMWAFAIYDEADGSLTLCRDRFGEKPLYLYREGDDLYFASEVKSIVALLGRRLEPDLDHLCRYLVNGYKALYKGCRTFFLGLRALPPGSWLRIAADGRETTGRYWQPRVDETPSMTYADAVARVRDGLVRAVELRLRADVPLAFCMSGGVDSNSLIGIAKNAFDYDVHGFTIMTADARYDESDVLTHAVKELGIRHTEIPVETTGFLGKLRRLVRHHDAPVHTITYFAHWLLMESVAAHGYRIAVSGTGADELFTGYYDHHLAYLAEVRGDAELHARSLAAWEALIRPLVRNPYLRDPELFARDPAFRDHIYLDAADFAAYLRRPWREPFEERCFTPALLRNRMLNELFHETVPAILHEDDLNAMSFSIENRSPFLDRSLFELAYSVPVRHLVRGGRAKAVLRDAVRGLVPDRVLDNPRKVGFNAPIYGFLDVADGDVRAQLLDRSPIFDLVHRERIETLLRKPDLPNSESKFLFYFLNAKLFLEELGR